MTDHMIGVVAAGEITVGLVSPVKGCYELAAPVRRYPSSGPERDDPDAGFSAADGLTQEEELESSGVHGMPMEAIAETIAVMIRDLCRDHGATPSGAGIGFPGIIGNGVIEDSPNLKQAKGARLAAMVTDALESLRFPLPVWLFNSADVTAAGLASTRGHLERLIRVWTLGHGVGFGRYPRIEGIWEGGHMVVTLDPKETYCGCGGRGHLEGIMGHRAMRLRFLDLEPDEIFANAQLKDPRCVEFEILWHRALAAATANSIHMDGPGKFYLAGPNSRFVKINLLSQFLHEMVTMSPLQGSVFEVVPMNDAISIIGAAVNAGLAANPGQVAGCGR
ncbi:MAG: glucokinase [Bryobacterales bacterium]|nr:glucokinase [Bryobacterales bacterium]